jgi:hypothetical protein
MRGIVNAFRTLALLAACLQVQSPARAYDIDNPGTIGIPVRTIKALQCEFTVNHTGTIGRSYRSGNSGEKLNITFAGLDFVKMTGQMIGNAGASEVIVLLSEEAIGTQVHFVEKTLVGNVNFTSVFFFSDPKKGSVGRVLDRQAFAVHSRHGLIYDQAVITQASGPCAIKY